MNVLHAIVLGITQGITEFLPISSSGHLIVVPWVMGWRFLIEHPSLNKTFDVALHLGTFIAVLAYFWRDVVAIIRDFCRSLVRRRIETHGEKLAWLLLLSTIPAGVIGVAFVSFIEDQLGRPWLIAVMTIAFGAVMWFVDGRAPLEREMRDLRWSDALLIGVAQVLALAPGVSRSGITIVTGRALKVEREAAARYSFLLTIPVIGGAAVYKALQTAKNGLPAGMAAPFVLGTVAAAVAGFAAVWFLLDYVRHHDLKLFVFYSFALGAAVLLVIASGLLPAGGL